MKNMALCLVFLFFSIFTTGSAFLAWDGHPVFETDQVHIRHQEHLTAGLALVPEGVKGANTTDTMRFAYDVFVPSGQTLKAELSKLTLVHDGVEIGNPLDVLISDMVISAQEEVPQGTVYTVLLTIQLQRVECQETMRLLANSSVRFSPHFDTE